MSNTANTGGGANANANSNAGNNASAAGSQAIPTAAEVQAWIASFSADELQLFQAATQFSQNDNLTKMCSSIAQAVGNSQNNLVVTTTAIKVPQFDKRRMTADYFFQEVKKYFEAQGHADSRHVYLLGTVLDGTLKRWYENNVDATTTWDSCLSSFKLEFDTRHDKSERLRLLVTRVQQSNEPVASFVYEMLFLASQVNAGETMREKLRRAFEGLHADIYQTIRWNPDMVNPTAGSLIAAANDALRILHRRKELQAQGQNALPPLPDSADVSKTVTPDSKEEKLEEQGENGYRYDNVSSRRTDSKAHSSYRDKENIAESEVTHESDQSTRNGQRSKVNRYRNEASSGNNSSSTYSRFSKDSAQVDMSVECQHCKGYGHEEVDCASKVRGVAMMFRHREITCWQCGGEGHAYYHCSSEILEFMEDSNSEEDYWTD